MPQTIRDVSPLRDALVTVVPRFECKYLVDPLIAPEIMNVVRLFAPLDPYSTLTEDRRYPICSLYLDTPDLALYRQTLRGEKTRFKLRLRTYSDDPETPVYFEVKRRMNGVIHKRRVLMTRNDVARFIEKGTNGWASHLPARAYFDLEQFAGHARIVGARPVVKVKYLREAYESTSEDRVRVTFDTELQHAVTLDYDFLHADARWRPTPVDGTILEIKFARYLPGWVSDIVHQFKLQQLSVPKYVLSVNRLPDEGATAALAIAGFALPAGRY